jgi:hypothetical protein
MVILLVVSVPIAFLNELNAIAALVLVCGADFLSLFDKPQRDALAMLFLNLYRGGIHVAEVFWGLWLFPLGMLVYHLGFLARILGVLLMAAYFAYLANSFTRLILPGYAHVVYQWISPLLNAELLFMLWLLIKGATRSHWLVQRQLRRLTPRCRGADFRPLMFTVTPLFG